MAEADAKPDLEQQLDELGAVIDDCSDRYIRRISELERENAEMARMLESEREQLRDRLAMAALARIGLGGARWVAVQAYEIADAMLDIRKTLLPRTTDDGGLE